MAEAEIIALREALCKQAETIQKLSVELEEERTAAASGADEALSMILRLQEEKALEKMEASQYKRMSEAKLLHADESLSSLKEAIFEKEVEIATLKFQVQSYRRKFLSYGIRDPDVEEVKEFVVGSNAGVRRQISLPTTWVDNMNVELGMIDENRPLLQLTTSALHDPREKPNWFNEQVRRRLHFESLAEETNFDSEEVQDARGQNTEEIVIPHNELKPNRIIGELCCGEKSSNLSERSLMGPDRMLNFPSSSIQMQKSCHQVFTHDIYEVPPKSKVSTVKAKQKAKVSCTFPQDIAELLESNEFSNRPPPLSMQNTKMHPSLEKETSMNSLAIYSIETFQNDVGQLKERVRLLENNQQVMEDNLQRINEGLSSIRGVKKQLHVVQSQAKVAKPMKISQQEEVLLSSITEALLSFAI
ncbi:hypothetical protein AXF42_Ash001853 [Apostasia shenzhenica]|uniref:GTD-binding domain-containing protein n=1 Tax=Apostasia shenzhenica TaxID=1088818 RepID=A0A2I0ABE6_9ASPA|nr:hypothetical protein AXF42_Ash001853 [Apostasia shenzhenica]